MIDNFTDMQEDMGNGDTVPQALRFYEQYFIEEEKKLPYEDTAEYFHDLLCMLDAGLQVILYDLSKEAGAYIPLNGIPFPQEKLNRAVYMNMIGNINMRIADHIRLDIEQMKEHIRERRSRSGIWGNSGKNRISDIVEVFSLSEFELFVLVLSLSVEYSRSYEGIYMYIHNDMNVAVPTKGLAVNMYKLLYVLGENAEKEFLYDQGRAARVFLNVMDNKCRLSDRLIVERHIAEYLLYGSEYPDFSIAGAEMFLVSEKLPEIIIRQDIEEELLNLYGHVAVDNKRHVMINMSGRQGNGRKYLIKHFARQIHMNVFFISLYDLVHQREDVLKNTVDKLNAYLKLVNGLLCIRLNKYSDDEAYNQTAETALKIIGDIFNFCFVISGPLSEAYLCEISNLYNIKVGWPDINEKILLWKEYAKGYHFHKDVEALKICSKYPFSVNGITNVLEKALSISVSKGRSLITEQDISSAVRQSQNEQLGSYVSVINAGFSLDDLIIDGRLKGMLNLICCQAEYRSKVLADWGFNKKLPYGRGVSAVFYGSPGTGKTMAAQVMAGRLDMDLYKVDLSQIVSKYIGETEKNITELFDKAKYMNVILFFDEADALFAKRLTVKDSNDRNANSMTAHLLQKFEEYEGIVILATNYINNIDEAFKRRIKYLVPFYFPDKKARLDLFKSIMPTEAVCDEELEFEFFAEHFELSGSSIKEVLVNAAYMAAGEGSGIKNIHIISAVKQNYAKYGKSLPDNAFGYLSK